MDELVIQNHDFEDAKNKIKEFSEDLPEAVRLNRVENSKDAGEFFGDLLFGRGLGLDHKVTGEELNELTSQIQEHLIDVNNIQIQLTEEFGEVYNALEALDKDYIQAILISIKTTEETSQSIQETQKQIKKIVENQRKTLEELNKFKQKLDGYVHLKDVDEMWESITSAHNIIQNNKVKFDAKNASAPHEANTAVESLAKRINYAYLIAGVAGGLTIIELLLLLMKVI